MVRLFRALALVLLLSACSATQPAAPTAAPAAAPTAAATVTPTALPTTAPTVPPTATPAAAPTAAPEGAAEPPAITDDLGREVTLAATPARIISLAPSITEMLYAVGAGPQVVGVTQYCNYPPEADALPEVGGYSAQTISVEAIADLTPDLVIAGSASQQPIVEALEQLDIPVIVLDPLSFEDVYETLGTLGEITGHAEQGAQAVETMRGRVEAVVAKVATVPEAQRPSVFWEVYDEPLMTAGPNTFIGQIITLLGAQSIFADATEDYPQISAELVIERNPAVILGPDTQSEKLTPELVGQRPGWADIRAVKEGRIYLLNGDTSSRPGPRLADVLEELARLLYPETFK